jgi:hypothetical protein
LSKKARIRRAQAKRKSKTGLLRPFRVVLPQAKLALSIFLWLFRQSLTTPLFLVVAFSLSAAGPRPYLRHKNLNPTAYLSRAIPDHLILGEILFRSPYILGEKMAARNISCHTCHPHGAASDALVMPDNSSLPGLVDLTHKSVNAATENNLDDALRIPALRGIRYLAPYGHDGRMHSLRDFTRDIVQNTFAGAQLDETELGALVSYMLEFDFLPNPHLTAAGKLHESVDSFAKEGEKIFLNAGCARCHDPQSYFTDGKVRRLAGKKTLSPFSFENGVKTPTLLRAKRARYLHDGSADFDSVLPTHAAQVGLTLSQDDIPPLKKYLGALMSEEKPDDGRHVAERAAELHSWLKLFEKDLPRSRQILVLKTLHSNFAGLRPEISTAADRYFLAVYLDGITGLIDLAGKQASRVMRAQVKIFSTRMTMGLRFFGTGR